MPRSFRPLKVEAWSAEESASTSSLAAALFLFFCASPTDPKSGEIWTTLRKLRKSFRVELEPAPATSNE